MYLIRAFEPLPERILLCPWFHSGRAEIKLLGRLELSAGENYSHPSRDTLTSRRSVCAAVVSAPRRVYPRNDGEFIMLHFSLASVDKANSSGRASCV
jgi:hypothetical protein